MKSQVEASWRGEIDYQKAWIEQEELAQEIRQGRTVEQIWGLEHPLVITLGKSSKRDQEIPEGPVVWVDRGGEATLHSPGQLVIYPLIQIKPQFEVRSWVEFLHQVSERCLLRFGIQTFRQSNSGLWTDQGKILFLGLRIKNGVSLHGLSMNVSNELSLFAPLKACGVRGAALDSFKNRGISVTSPEVFEVWLEEFRGLSCQRAQI